MAEQPNQRRWNDSVSELPAFYGNEKDTISAESIVHRVEAAANALTWDDEATYNNFSLAMRANAEEWLTLQADVRGPEFRRSWAYIKPLFRAAFGSKMDESKVFLALREIGQKPSECIRDFAIRFNKGWRTIKDLMKPKAINVPANEADRTVAVCQGLYAQGFADAQMEFQRIMFVSTMEMPLLTRVVQKDIPTFVDAMEVATKIENLTKSTGITASIHKIQETDETSDAEFVNQIQHGYHNNRGNYRGNNRGRSNSRGQSRGNRGNSRGNYSNNWFRLQSAIRIWLSKYDARISSTGQMYVLQHPWSPPRQMQQAHCRWQTMHLSIGKKLLPKKSVKSVRTRNGSRIWSIRPSRSSKCRA
jgi:hypothetical protein